MFQAIKADQLRQSKWLIEWKEGNGTAGEAPEQEIPASKDTTFHSIGASLGRGENAALPQNVDARPSFLCTF